MLMTLAGDWRIYLANRHKGGIVRKMATPFKGWVMGILKKDANAEFADRNSDNSLNFKWEQDRLSSISLHLKRTFMEP